MGMAATQQTGGPGEREKASKAVLLRVPLTWSWHLTAGYRQGGRHRGGDGFKLHWGVIIQPLGWSQVSWLVENTALSGSTEPNKRLKFSILGFCNLN